MNITQHPFPGRSHLPHITNLIYQHGHHQATEVADAPYRLASWSLDHPENVALWQDQTGRLLAYAAIQEPFLTLDYAIHPDARPHNLESQIVQWAINRSPAIAHRQQRTFPLYLWVNGSEDPIIPLLESFGFIEDDWQKITYTRPLQSDHASRITYHLPPGFTLRPLNGSAEVEAYVELHRAAFQTKNMTVEWRQRTLQMPQYRPDLDLVIAAPDGRLAAFCITWLHPNGRTGEIEPLGVHPDFQRLGLGRAIALAALHRLQTLGATQANVTTDGERDPARQLYESIGFQRQSLLLGYGRVFRP
jgi:ribosomal protein S18 acetylase RimI-like enzyme